MSEYIYKAAKTWYLESHIGGNNHLELVLLAEWYEEQANLDTYSSYNCDRYFEKSQIMPGNKVQFTF